MSFRSWWQQEYEFYGVFKENGPYHFYLLQCMGFLYLIYWFLSKDFSVYGFFQHPEGMFYEDVYVGWPVPWAYFTTGQFIYQWLPHPSPGMIEMLQWIIIGIAMLGVCGVVPKLAAILSFLLVNHLVGMEILFNSNMDGSTTLPLCLLLVLAVSPAESFYRYNRFNRNSRSVHYHWPVFLYLLLVGAYYTTAGLNKVIEVGPHWPFVLHLERLAAQNLETAIFVSSQYRNAWVLSLMRAEWFSVVSGLLTFLAEILFFTILFLPRYRPWLVGIMIGLHGMVFLTLGWNYTAYALFLVLCLDFNTLLAKKSEAIRLTDFSPLQYRPPPDEAS